MALQLLGVEKTQQSVIDIMKDYPVRSLQANRQKITVIEKATDPTDLIVAT